MTLPVADAQIGFEPPGDRATVPTTVLPVFIPAGGNPAFPSEVTDPAGPQFLAILLPTAGEGLPDSAPETARPGGSPGFMETGRRTTTLVDKFRPLASSSSGGRDAVVAEFSDWYVDDIWILPAPIDFGTIITSKQVTVSILNTFRYEERTLNSIDISALGAGVSILSDPSPETLQPQQDLNVTFEAVIDGPPNINDDTVFSFDNGSIAVLTTGIRLILFWFPPESDISEQLTWKTAIIKRRDGTEQRQSLRTTPRQLIRYSILAEDDIDAEATELRTLLLAFRPFLFGIPIWFEQRQVTASALSGAIIIQVDTTDIDHRVGASIMIFEPGDRSFFDATILSFTDTAITLELVTPVAVSEDAIVIPVRFGFITREPQFDDHTNTLLNSVIEFQTTDNVDLAFADQAALEAAYPVHPEDSIVVLSDPNIVSGARTRRSMRSNFTTIDAGIGLPQLFAKEPLSDILGPKRTRARSLADIRRWRSLLHFLRGSFRPFYLPTFRNDLPPVFDFALNASTITVADTDLELNFGVKEPHRSIMLELPDGRQFFARINSVTEVSGNEQLTLVNPFDASVETVTASTARISFLEFVRIDGDVATLIHQWVGNASITFQTRTLQG